MVKIALGRTGAATAAPQHHGDPVGDDGLPSRTDGDRPGRSSDGEPTPPAARAAEHDADEVTAAEAAYLRDLVPAALAATAELAGQGRPLSREALADILRRQGHAMSNARASALVKLVKQHSNTTTHTAIRPSTTDKEVSAEPGRGEPGQQVLPAGVRHRGPP